jgi:DNA-binding FrmR family transcriptional regulator
MQNEDVIKRLKNIEGHLHGIRGMVEQDEYCINIIQQIHAVQAALNKLNLLILNDHLHSCVTTAIRGDNQSEREKVLQEIVQLYETATKV